MAVSLVPHGGPCGPVQLIDQVFGDPFEHRPVLLLPGRCAF